MKGEIIADLDIVVGVLAGNSERIVTKNIIHFVKLLITFLSLKLHFTRSLTTLFTFHWTQNYRAANPRFGEYARPRLGDYKKRKTIIAECRAP